MANMEYLNKYEKDNLRQIRLKINRKTEPELLEWIEKQENIQGYIKRLILEDMKREKRESVEPVVPFNNDGIWACPRCKSFIGPYMEKCYCGAPIEWEKVTKKDR